MFLIHTTENEFINDILKDGYLKSNKLTGNINLGDGVYIKPSPFIFFTVLKFKKQLKSGPIMLCFRPTFIYNYTFWLATSYQSNPSHTFFKNDKHYNKKYNKNYSNYQNALNKLYDDSKNEQLILNQVAIKNKFKIVDYLYKIYVNNNFSGINMKLLHEKYPNVKVEYL